MCTSFGRHLDIIWTSFGHHLDIIWTSYGNHLDITWTSFGHHLDIIWTSFGLRLGSGGEAPWLSMGCWGRRPRQSSKFARNVARKLAVYVMGNCHLIRFHKCTIQLLTPSTLTSSGPGRSMHNNEKNAYAVNRMQTWSKWWNTLTTWQRTVWLSYCYQLQKSNSRVSETCFAPYAQGQMEQRSHSISSRFIHFQISQKRFRTC